VANSIYLSSKLAQWIEYRRMHVPCSLGWESVRGTDKDNQSLIRH